MTKNEFLQYMNDIGINYEKIDIFISDTPKYYECVIGCCKKDDKWIRFSNIEREGVYVYGSYDEEECFNILKEYVPRLISNKGVRGVFKNNAYAITRQEIIDYIIKEYQLSQHQADMYYEKIKQSLFILMEFKYYIKTKSFLNEKHTYNCYGITAEKLVNEYNRLPLEAFAYLTSLMNKSEEEILKIKSMLRPKT